MASEMAKERGILALAKIVAIAQAGVEPTVMGTGPIPAVELVVSSLLLILKKKNLVKNQPKK